MQEIQPYYTKLKTFETKLCIPFLFPFKPKPVELYQRTKEFTTLKDSRFAAMPLNEQLMLITFYLKNSPLSSAKAGNILLDVLQKKQNIDPTQYNISNETLHFIKRKTP